jgi:hypothetical protein
MKTEEDVRALLRDAARGYQVAPPPTPLVIDIGRRAKGRRLALIVGGVAASVLALATVTGLAAHEIGRSNAVGPSHGRAPKAVQQAAQMPRLLGLTPQEAREAMTAMHGRYGTGWTTETAATTCNKVGTVVAQDPAPRDRVTAEQIGGMSITIGKAERPFACDDVPAADRRVAQAFAAFADDLGANRLPPADAPFAPQVALGMGNAYEKTISRAQTADYEAWGIRVDGYATTHGTLMAPDDADPLIDFLHLTTDLKPSSCTVTISDAPSPLLTQGGHALRIYNGSPESCWEDKFVDLYIDDAGQIVGVNLILGAPEDMQDS